jgi:DNA-binding response OmpR family regulator
MELLFKILVVDDELQIQFLLEEFLTSLGHTVLWFTRNGHLHKGDKIGKGGVR